MSEFSEIFSRAPDAVFAETRRIVYRNRAFDDLFQRAATAARPGKCYEVVCGRTLEGKNFCDPDCPVGNSLLAGRAVGNFDLAVPRGKGQSQWLSVGAIPASETAGKPVAIFALRPIRVSGIPLRSVAANRPDADGTLTRRERQILDLLAQGLNAPAVARQLHILVLSNSLRATTSSISAKSLVCIIAPRP